MSVFKEMVGCWITHNLGIYLQKLCHRTCTFPLSSRILPELAPLNPPKTPLTLLVGDVLPFASAGSGAGEEALSLKVYREDLLTFMSVLTHETVSSSSTWFPPSQQNTTYLLK